jgi:hypothetical protein
MDIFVKSIFAALLATIVFVVGGNAFLKTNDLRNYPNLRPQNGKGNGVDGMADIVGRSATTGQGAGTGNREMTAGQKAAAESGFSTELANPNK